MVYKNYKKFITLEAWEKKFDDVKISKKDMNKLVMDLLVTEGHVDAAKKFNYESGTQQIDLDTMSDRCAVRKAVECGDIEDAIGKINELNPEILDKNPLVYFRLQQQRFIEYIRNGKIEEALEIAQEDLAPCVEENQSLLQELERTVAFLGFEDPTKSPYGALLNMSQRQKTAREANVAILVSQGLEKDPKVSRVVKTMIWAQRKLATVAIFPYADFLTGDLEDPSSW